MSKEEKKWDLKPIAKKERELKSWVAPQRFFLFSLFFSQDCSCSAAVCFMPVTGCITTRRTVSDIQSWYSI